MDSDTVLRYPGIPVSVLSIFVRNFRLHGEAGAASLFRPGRAWGGVTPPFVAHTSQPK